MSSFHFKKVTHRLKRYFRPGETGRSEADELHNKPTPANPSPAQPASATEVTMTPITPTPGDGATGEIKISRDLWQIAFDQLKDPGRRDLLTAQLQGIRHAEEQPTYKTALDSVIETVQDQYEIRNLKNDKKIRKAAKQILNATLGIQQYANAIVPCDSSGYAYTAWSVVSLGFMMTRNYFDQQDQWFESAAFLADTIHRSARFEIFYLNKNPKAEDSIEKALIQVYVAILNYSAEVIKINRSRMGKKILKSVLALNQLPLTEIKTTIQNEELHLESAARMQEYFLLDSKADAMLSQGEQVLEKVQNVDNQLVLASLPIAERATFNSHTNEPQDYCLENTRVDLFEEIQDWVDSSTANPIFWLQGMAGTGKSTISRTIARDLKQRGILGATFFFNRSEQDRSTSHSLLTTMAKQLIDILPQFQDDVLKAIKKDSTLVNSSLGEQFDRILKDPLSAVKAKTSQKLLLVIIIDALDECQDEINIQTIIKRLSEIQHVDSTVELRFFMTSRPESRILSGFNAVQDKHTVAILHEIPQSIVEHDIKVFFQSKLPKIRNERGLDDTWPGEANIQKLVQMTAPLFIYAATIYRVFEDPIWDPQDSLENFLDHPDRQSSQLSGTYLPVLERLTAGQGERQVLQLVNEFQNVVGPILILQNSLPIMSLAELLNIRETAVQTRLNTLQSVIRMPREAEEPVKLFHQSFRDYLLDPGEKSQFSVDRVQMNKTIGLHCIRVMERENGGLKRNICDISSFGTLRTELDPLSIQAKLPTELQYACRYWVSHLHQGHVKLVDHDEIHHFLKKHFLHWLEALGLMGVITEAVGMTNILMSIVKDVGSEFSSFLYDEKRFILENSRMVDIAPLQLYSAGLVFSPMKSYIRQKFQMEKSKKIYMLPQVKHSWDAKLQTLEGHSGEIFSIAFSPDGKTLVSGSYYGTKIWDTITGKEKITLRSSRTYSVAFSPCGQTVVSGSDDGTKIWDIITGKEKITLQSSATFSVAVSPDGQTVASVSSDGLNLWDATTGKKQFAVAFQSQNFKFDLAILSPDGKTMATVFYRNIKLWDAITGKEQCTLQGHSDLVTSVTFSPNGKTLASGSYDKTIKLWDAATGKEEHTIQDHSGPALSVVFSADGQIVVSAGISSIKFWDLITHRKIYSLRGHYNTVTSIAISPDDQTVASGSYDKTIKLWDTITGKEQHTLQGHSDPVSSVAFSPDGQRVASGSYDKTIKLWDATTGTEQHTLQGHSSPVLSVAFSPDGQTVISGSFNKTIRYWDVSTGQEQNTAEALSHSSVNRPSPHLSFGDGWVSFGSERLLWLPSEYRGFSHMATKDGLLVLGYKDGKVLIMRFCWISE